MTQAQGGFRKEVVHALTSSGLFRREARKKREIMAATLSPGERLSEHFIEQSIMENLAVSQRHQATPKELQEAFIRLSKRSLRHAPIR